MTSHPVRRALACLGLLALTLVHAASARAEWARTYGGPTPGEGVHAIREMGNGELVVLATTDGFGTATGDGWLIRLDADGTVQSQAVVGNPAPGGVDGAVVLADGGAVFASRNVRDIFIKHDATITRLAADGTPAWTTDITADPGRFFVNDIVAVSDGTFLGVGQAALSDAGPAVAWLVRLAADGSVMWQQYHGGVADTNISLDAGIETSDGGFAVTGWMASAGGEEAFVAKLTSTGGVSWARTYGGSGADRGNAIVEIPGGGGYAIAGATDSFTTAGHAGWVFRVSATGALSWNAVLGDAEWGDLQAITLGSGGDLVVLGRLSEPGFATNDLWALSLAPATGAINWQRAYEGDSGDYANELTSLADGGLLMAGAWGWGFPEEDLWLLRTDALGQIPSCGLVRDTRVTALTPAVTSASEFLPPYPPIGSDSTGSVVSAPSSLGTRTQCDRVACTPLRCGAVTQAPDPACGPGNLTLTAAFSGGTPPFAVTWDLDGDTIAEATGNPVVASFAAGNHDITTFIVDSCPGGPLNCSWPTTVVVHPDQTPTITPDGPTTFCAVTGEMVTLDAGAGYASYQWMQGGVDLGGQTAQQLFVNMSGAYSVRVVDGNGCTWTSAPVVIDAEDCSPCAALACQSIVVDPPVACGVTPQSFELLFTGGEGTITITWDLDGDTVLDATGNPVGASLPVGTTRVTAFAADSCPLGPDTCSVRLDVTVHPDQTPTIVPDGPTAFCAAAGEDVVLDAGAGYASYQWTEGGGDLAGQTAQQLTIATSGSYAVRVVDANGCTWTSGSVAINAAFCQPCAALTCDSLSVTPLDACEGTQQAFELLFGGGEAPVTISWDIDGDTVADLTGNPVAATLPVGITTVTAFATDSCPTGAASCQIGIPVEIRSGTPPGEVSDVVAGAVPLLVTEHGDRVSFEDRAAAAYSLYADSIGSWYAPNAASGSACFIATTPDGAGRLRVAPTLAANTWLVVTASSTCAEGSAGQDSAGVERMSVGTWTACGAAP